MLGVWAGRRMRYALFLLLAVTINVVAGLTTRAVAGTSRGGIVTVAATFDIVIVVSVLYYLLLVRPGIRAWHSLGVIALAGGLRASFLYPSGSTARAVIAGLLEAGVLGLVVTAIRRSKRAGGRETAVDDPLDTIEAAVSAYVALPALAKMLTAELAALYYALAAWRTPPHVPPGARAFSMYRRSGLAGVWGVIAFVGPVEILVQHVFIALWSPAVAWVTTAAGFYGLVWFVGFARALKLRPVIIAADYMDIRYGLLFRMRVPRSAIASVRPADGAERVQATVLPSRRVPTIRIELTAPREAVGLFGRRRQVHVLALSTDDDAGVRRALDEMVSARGRA